MTSRIWWPEIAGPRWPLYPKCTVQCLFYFWSGFVYVIMYIEISTFSQNIILHNLQLNRDLQAVRNNDVTDM